MPMRRLVGAELRRLARWWPAWPLAAAVVAAGVTLLPLNADVYLAYIYNDPQGAEQELEAYRADLAAAATSGLGWAQLATFVFGAASVLLEGPRTPPHPSRIVAKAAAAGVAGLLLAAVDVAVVLPQVPAALAGTIGAPDVDLAAGPVWTVVTCGALQVALFGVLGVGLAATAGRWWPLLIVAGVVAGGAAAFLAKDSLYALAGLVSLPMLLLWYLMVTGAAPVATLLSALAAGCALATGLIRASRHRDRQKDRRRAL
jgi:hypothetical protein